MKKIKLIYKIFLSTTIILIMLLLLNSFINASVIQSNKNDYISTKVIKHTFNDREIIRTIDNIKNKLENNENITYQYNIVNENLLSILYEKENNNYESYLINLNTFNNENINIIFKNRDEDLFLSKINEMLLLKYPKFLADELLNGDGIISYLVLNNEIYIYFSGYETTSKLKNPVYIRINYHELAEALNINYYLDEIYINDNIFKLDKNKKTIAFTFDDGPKVSTTSKLLEILNDNHATATFFMVGNHMHNTEQLIKDLVNKGNEIGNHSYSHKNLAKLARTNIEEMFSEINKTNETLYEITGYYPTLFRMPYGVINDILKSSIKVPIVSWSVDTLDWKYKDSQKIKNNILNSVKDGDIILMHDIHLTTIEAVKISLPELYINGYQIVSVSKMAELKGIKLNSGQVYHNLK